MSTLPRSESRAAASLMTQVRAQAVYHFTGAGGGFLDDKDALTEEWVAWRNDFAADLIRRLHEWAPPADGLCHEVALAGDCSLPREHSGKHDWER